MNYSKKNKIKKNNEKKNEKKMLNEMARSKIMQDTQPSFLKFGG